MVLTPVTRVTPLIEGKSASRPFLAGVVSGTVHGPHMVHLCQPRHN